MLDVINNIGNLTNTFIEVLSDANLILTSNGRLDIQAMIEDYKQRHHINEYHCWIWWLIICKGGSILPLTNSWKIVIFRSKSEL
jgi:hypothetical protein